MAAPGCYGYATVCIKLYSYKCDMYATFVCQRANGMPACARGASACRMPPTALADSTRPRPRGPAGRRAPGRSRLATTLFTV